MSKKRKRRRKIRWGRVSLLLLVIAAVVTCSVTHPIDKVRHYLALHNRATSPVESDSVCVHARMVDKIFESPRHPLTEFDAQGNPIKNRILSVPDYGRAFPDENDVQLATATHIGLKRPIKDRADAEGMKEELVYIGASPFYDMRPMHYSIPYLVPRADRLLTEIARNFQDSLVSKGLPMHKIVISSVLRTEEDVKKLRRGNANAKDQSCHRFGTTFDISYNYYTRVQAPEGEQMPELWGVQLKQVLAEVLRDQRDLGTCYVKYEYRKPCFHITCR